MIDQQTLPTLQSAVDALFGRVTAGRGDRANGTAIVTGLTGRVDNLTEDETAILGDAMGSKYGDRLLDIWSRDELHAAGASEDDWALESEFAYQAIRRGLDGDALKLTVERIMRAGPYRSKHDERRGDVTWLAQDVANAIATKQESLKKYQSGPTFGWDEETASEAPAADETIEQKIARLERALAAEKAGHALTRGVVAVQQLTIRRERADKEAARETIRTMFDVLAIPDQQMSARAKITYLFATREAASRNSRGGVNLPNIAIAEGTGLPEDVVSEIMQDIPAREGSVIERHVTRDWAIGEDGESRPRSTARVTIVTEDGTYVSALRAALTMGGPSDKAQQKKAKAKARTATSLRERAERQAATWGHCTRHDNDLVDLKAYCPETDCGEIVGERPLRVEEFEILNPGFQDSGSGPTPPVVVRVKGPVFQDSGSVTTQAPLLINRQNRAMRDSAARTASPSREPVPEPTPAEAGRAAEAAAIPLTRDVDRFKRWMPKLVPTSDQRPPIDPAERDFSPDDDVDRAPPDDPSLADWPDERQQQPPPPRCASSGCTRPTAPGDGWYCAPCRVLVSEPAVMAGAEE